MQNNKLLLRFSLIKYVFFKNIISLFFLSLLKLTVINLNNFIYVLIETNKPFFSDNLVFNEVF